MNLEKTSRRLSAPPPQAGRKARLYYTIRQLPMRDELVLKSMMGLVAERARHDWVYSDRIQVDLVILGNARTPPDPALDPALDQEARAHAMVLCVAPDGAPRLDSLYLPLHWHDVLRHLDASGDMILDRRGRAMLKDLDRLKPGARGQSDPPTSREGHASVPKSKEAVRYALTRWPSKTLIGLAPEHLKLASMLSAQSLSLAELVNRSGIPVATCATFLECLLIDQSGRVIPSTAYTASAEGRSLYPDQSRHYPAPHDPALPPVNTGLIDRIRAKLRLPPRVGP